MQTAAGGRPRFREVWHAKLISKLAVVLVCFQGAINHWGCAAGILNEQVKWDLALNSVVNTLLIPTRWPCPGKQSLTAIYYHYWQVETFQNRIRLINEVWSRTADGRSKRVLWVSLLVSLVRLSSHSRGCSVLASVYKCIACPFPQVMHIGK